MNEIPYFDFKVELTEIKATPQKFIWSAEAAKDISMFHTNIDSNIPIPWFPLQLCGRDLYYTSTNYGHLDKIF